MKQIHLFLKILLLPSNHGHLYSAAYKTLPCPNKDILFLFPQDLPDILGSSKSQIIFEKEYLLFLVLVLSYFKYII